MDNNAVEIHCYNNRAYASSLAQNGNHHGTFITDNVITNLFTDLRNKLGRRADFLRFAPKELQFSNYTNIRYIEDHVTKL
jgi:hypothetical protein